MAKINRDAAFEAFARPLDETDLWHIAKAFGFRNPSQLLKHARAVERAQSTRRARAS